MEPTHTTFSLTTRVVAFTIIALAALVWPLRWGNRVWTTNKSICIAPIGTQASWYQTSVLGNSPITPPTCYRSACRMAQSWGKHWSMLFLQKQHVIIGFFLNVWLHHCECQESKSIADHMLHAAITNCCFWVQRSYTCMQIKASINSIIMVLLSVGGLYRCQCVAQPSYNQPRQLLK